MSFQSGVNQAIGTVGALAGVKKVVQGQQQSNELAKAQQEHLANKEVDSAQRQLETAKTDLETNENDAMKNALTLDKAGWDKAVQTVARNTEGRDIQTGDVLNEYQNQKLESVKEEWRQSMWDAQMKPSKKSNIRLDKATEALNRAKGEIEATRQLKFNLKQAEADLQYAKEYQSKLGGNK